MKTRDITSQSPRQTDRLSWRISLIYLVAAGCWIAVSDWVVLKLVPHAADITEFQTLKGWAFVILTAGFLFAGLRAQYRRWERTEKDRLLLMRAVEQSIESIVITDTTGAIVYANPAFTQVTGYTSEDVVGRNPRLLKSGKQDPDYYRAMWDVLSRGEVWSGRFINRKKDGSLFEEEASISPVRDASGKITNFVAVKRDVTREVALESQFRQSQKMEAFGQLAGGVAHDFNNILTVIMGYASMLTASTKLEDRTRDMINEIFAASERAANLTRQLLTFSRKKEMSAGPLNLNQVISGLTKMLRRIIGETISMRCDLEPDLPAIHADEGMIEQVLMNLVINARDAMPRGGQLTITTELMPPGKAIHPETHRPATGKWVCLSVRDSGCGMSPELQTQIFEPFFTTKGAGKGTGLGLATVYGIVKQHSGWIEVESRLGHGSIFKIILPVAAVSEQVDGKPDGMKTIHSGSETILLVEDESSVREVVKAALEQRGYRVLTADSGETAMQAWARHGHEIRLLLTDMVLPGCCSGRELAKQLKDSKPGLKTLYSSGYSSKGTDTAFFRNGGESFLPKPCTAEELAKAVRECLDRN